MGFMNNEYTDQEIKTILTDALHRELTDTEHELVDSFSDLNHGKRAALLELLKELVNKQKTI